jgi:hypothetical protein
VVVVLVGDDHGDGAGRFGDGCRELAGVDVELVARVLDDEAACSSFVSPHASRQPPRGRAQPERLPESLHASSPPPPPRGRQSGRLVRRNRAASALRRRAPHRRGHDVSCSARQLRALCREVDPPSARAESTGRRGRGDGHGSLGA